MQNIQCPKHNENPAVYLCLDESCNESRIYCHRCHQENRHYANPQRHHLIDSLPEFLLEQLDCCQNLLNYIEDNFRRIIEFKEHLISSIRRKYHISSDQFNRMESQSKSEAVNSLIRTKKISKTIHNIMNPPFELMLEKLQGSIREVGLEQVQYPEQISQQQTQQLQAYLNESILLSQNGRNVEALQQIDYALAVDARNVQALNKKGDILMNINQPAEAFRIFQTVLQIDSRNVQALLGQGQYYQRIGNNQRALNYFFQANEIDPNNQDALDYINLLA